MLSFMVFFNIYFKFGFNGGSEFLDINFIFYKFIVIFILKKKQRAINSRAVNAIVTLNLAASVGSLTWMFTEMIINKSKKMSLNDFCCGAVSGLVTITPASGFVSPAYAIIIGFLGLNFFE